MRRLVKPPFTLTKGTCLSIYVYNTAHTRLQHSIFREYELRFFLATWFIHDSMEIPMVPLQTFEQTEIHPMEHARSELEVYSINSIPNTRSSIKAPRQLLYTYQKHQQLPGVNHFSPQTGHQVSRLTPRFNKYWNHAYPAGCFFRCGNQQEMATLLKRFDLNERVHENLWSCSTLISLLSMWKATWMKQ